MAVVIDPGHDGGNGQHPSEINRQVDDGVGTKACDTAGTQTDDGYTEHAFTWDVANRLAQLLRSRGAIVYLTRANDVGVGPCVNQRAALGNQHPGAIGISIHADGGPAGARGFHVIRPAGISGLNTAIVAPSSALAIAVRDAVASGTGEPMAGYVGATNGIVARNDLGGLNLSQIPKVFVECLNMRDQTDAALARDPAFRQRLAAALADGLARYSAGAR
ncbi:MAG TPA: N-acetylmuramoyl-L-alanine amidase [Acidimicrobiales bacterium]|jgi:N-acetylmuramoyl-L-alanine amidase|nr:N-acetylmuramoyl-L-alanine amidase [Acidimicrobiales bacterium]